MAVTIDSLELKIQHESDGAVKGIDRLVRALRRLKTAAGMGADLSAVAKGIRAIASATGSLSGSKMKKVLDGIKTSASETKEKVEEVKKSLSMADISNAAHATIKKKVPDHWDVLMEKARKGIDLWKTAQAVEESARRGFSEASTSPIDNYSKEWEIFGNTPNTNSVSYGNEVLEYANNYKTAAEKAKELKEQQKQIKQHEKELQAEADRRHKVEDQVVKDYQKQQAAAQKLAQKNAEKQQKNSIKQQTQDAKASSEQISQVVGLFSKGAAIAMKIGGKIMGSVTGIFKKAFSGYKRLVNTIKRMILLRIIRNALKIIEDGLQEGRENIYRYSVAIGDIDAAHAKSTLNELATAALYVKNSIGAAAMPAIQAFTPLLKTLASWAVQAANAINQLISAMQGKSSFTRAKEYAVDYMDSVKDSAGGASKAAKDLRATLLGFDEINRLDAKDNGSGSGGGGGGSAKLDYKSMFEEATIDSDVSAFVDKIKDKIKSGDWNGIGTLIGNKLNEVISKIDTKTIGKKITTVISNGAKLVSGFLKATDFVKIGEKIEDFIDGAIEGIDEKAFADVLSNLVTGIIDGLKGFIDQASKNDTMRKVSYKLLIFIKRVLINIKDYLVQNDWAKTGEKLFDMLEDWIEGAKDADAKSVAETFWNTIGVAMASVLELRAGFWKSVVEKLIGNLETEIRENGLVKTIYKRIGLLILGGTLTATGNPAISLGSLLWRFVVRPVLSGMSEKFASTEAGTFYRTNGSKILGGLLSGLANAIGTELALIGAYGAVIVKKIIGEDAFNKAFDLGKKIISKVKEGMLKMFEGTPFEGVAKKLINNFFNPIEKAVIAVDTGLGKVLDKMTKVGQSKVSVKTQYYNGVSGATGYYTKMKAAGGYVDQGDLFIANEAGPELIGTVNGRTAVAPNAEITGIANAVYTMGEREIAAINNLIRALNEKDMTAVVTADSIVAGLARKNRRDGVSTVPVSI